MIYTSIGKRCINYKIVGLVYWRSYDFLLREMDNLSGKGRVGKFAPHNSYRYI